MENQQFTGIYKQAGFLFKVRVTVTLFLFRDITVESERAFWTDI